MVDLRFSNEHSRTQVAEVVDMLRQPRLWVPTDQDYPNHTAWLDRTEALIASGDKHAMAVFMGKRAAGTVIYQRPPEQPSVLEIRNISISPEVSGRHVGHFLLHTAEIEAARTDFPGIESYIVDTKITNTEMIAFLESQGYTIQDITDLYGLGAGLDVVMTKPVSLLPRVER